MPHVHELYEEDFPLHCDGCGDSFSALAIINRKNAELADLRATINDVKARLRLAAKGMPGDALVEFALGMLDRLKAEEDTRGS